MRTRNLALLLTISLTISLPGCTEEDKEAVNCTEEFRSARVKVPGEPLTEFFTIRLSNSDTIRYPDKYDPKQGYYLVLDDSYQPKLEGRQDTFRFIGKRNNIIVVQEDYVFKADQCHITKVSGKDQL